MVNTHSETHVAMWHFVIKPKILALFQDIFLNCCVQDFSVNGKNIKTRIWELGGEFAVHR